jgi:DNA-binding response OmpR family regulator
MEPRHHVLVVDDDSMIRTLLATLLKRIGVGCDFAANGDEAIARLQQRRYSVILLDLMMPHTDGFGVLHWLRTSGIMTPVVVVTAAGAGKTKDLDPSRVKAILTKPFEIHELTDTVTAICEAHDVRDVAG